MKNDLRTFLISYQHDGKTWGEEIKARDFEDAEIRLAKLRHAKLDGELMFTIPAELGLFAKIAIYIRNALWRGLPS